MSNIVIFEKSADLFHEILEIYQETPHFISMTTSLADITEDGNGQQTDLLIFNKTNNIPITKLFKKITSFKTPPKILVVVDKPNITELEYSLREGALDYIKRSVALEHLQALLGRLDHLTPTEGLSWVDVGKRFNIVGECIPMRECLTTVAKASQSDVSVLIHGETGTGKELFARAIHGLSRRNEESLIVVDCASLPATLVESILFGYSKGAFTGADTENVGLVMRAHKGTLFLDEVSELPLELQKKFLRVLQERRFRPVGAKREVVSDFRLVAATNKDLTQMVKDGLFRSDLLYRLQSLKLNLPPLRERLDDLPGLVGNLLKKSCEKNRIPEKSFSKEFVDMLSRHDWPGNIRELENALDSIVATSHNQPAVYPEQLPFYIRVKAAKRSMGQQSSSPPSSEELPQHTERDFSGRPFPAYKKYRVEMLEPLEKQYFTELYRINQGNLASAMRMANLSRARLYEFYKKYNITKGAKKEE